MRKLSLLVFVVLGVLLGCDNDGDNPKPGLPCKLEKKVISIESISESIINDYPELEIHNLYFSEYTSSLDNISENERDTRILKLKAKYKNMSFKYFANSLNIYFDLETSRENILIEWGLISEELDLVQGENSRIIFEFIVPKGEEEKWIAVFEERSDIIYMPQLCY